MIDTIIALLYNVLFFATPLIMTKTTSELFEFNKMLFIYAATVLISFFWAVKMIVNRKIILKKTPLDIPIVIFLLSQVVSTVLSIDVHTSIFGYYGRFNGGLLSILSYIILYYGFVSNKINLKTLLKTILVSSFLVIAWAIPGHFNHDLTCLLFTGSFSNNCWDNSALAFRPELRAFSTLGQPNWLGAYLAITFFIGVYYLVKNIDIKNVETQNFASLRTQIITLIYLFFNFSMILMSRSRSGIGAVIVGLVLFIGYYWFFIKTNFKKLLIILLLVTIIPVLFFKTGETKIDKFLTFQTYKNIFVKNLNSTCKGKSCLTPTNYVLPTTNSLNITGSFDIRRIVWEGAWKLALKYPLFGTGVETFAYSYYLVRPVAHNLTSEWDYVYNKAHNEYFNYLATTGFIGLGSYLGLIFIFHFSIFNQFLKFKFSNNEKSLKNDKFEMKNKSLLIFCLFISYITILITNFFGFSTTTIQLFFFLTPAFVIADCIRLHPIASDLIKGSPQGSIPTEINTLQKFFIFLLLASSIYLLTSIVIYYIADVNYSFGLKYSKLTDEQKAAQYFETALKLRDEPVYMDRFSSSLAYLSAVASVQKEAELSKQIAELADQYNLKTVQKYPKNVFYWKTRAKNMYYFYLATNQEQELFQGVQALEEAKKLAPTDPKITYSLALYDSMLYDASTNAADKNKWQTESLSEILATVKLKSNYREGYLLEGQLMKKYGLAQAAKEVFEGMLKRFDPKDAEVLKEMESL